MRLLTVVIPLYNQEKYIQQCIESIANQSYFDIDIIIVDDGSTDNSNEICHTLMKTDNRIRLIRKENGGVISAIREGVKKCNTKYVTFVDADDFILKDAYIYALDAMQKDIDMITFEIARYYSEEKVKREPHIIDTGYYDRNAIETTAFPKMIWDFSKNTPGIDCSLCTKIMKTNQLREVLKQEVKDIKIYYGDDVAIIYPMFLQIKDMQVIGECYYMHRQRNSEIAPYIKRDLFFGEVYELYRYLVEIFKKTYYYGMFRKQIEYFYMYSVNLKKMKYNDYFYVSDFLFPFEKIPQGAHIILYGAGTVGKTYYKQLEKSGYCREVLWVDKDAGIMEDDRIKNIDQIDNSTYEYIVIAIENRRICNTIREWLIKKGVAEKKIILGDK